MTTLISGFGVLGDGKQTKSYIHVDDCVEALISISAMGHDRMVEIYNVGSDDWINVSEIAWIVMERMGLEDVDMVYTGGVDGGRGWPGDVKEMLLDVSKIRMHTG